MAHSADADSTIALTTPPPTQVMAMTSRDSGHSPKNDPSAASTTLAGPYKDAKTFRDLHGAQWFVHEVSGDTLGGGRRCLLLVSAEQVRRLESYPADWHTLAPAALLELPHASL